MIAIRMILQYPYAPPHITKPKECKKLFLVTIPPTSKSPPLTSAIALFAT